ncbi:MAG TPA: VOC family protein [Candidatus Dormibacteraeota bacterium]|jgi:catechol 2,3-dioxygenase|nr:VOC family protein [Candidatus Dormibacteraeota bacterium]
MSSQPRTRQVKPRYRNPRPLAAGVDIGHVHLRAADLSRIRAFYVDLLGFDVIVDMPAALFVSAGGYHHTLGFNTWETKGGAQAPPGTTGLYHIAIRYPTRADLGDALRRLVEADWPIDGANDHGTHEAIYLRDSEGNGLELCWDRPEEEWPVDAEGHLAFGGAKPDVEGLLREGVEPS